MNIWQRLAAIESRLAVLELSSQGTDLIGDISDRNGKNPNDYKPVNLSTPAISETRRQNGAYPVNRNGKVYWRMPAGAAESLLLPASRKERARYTPRRQQAPVTKIVTK